MVDWGPRNSNTRNYHPWMSCCNCRMDGPHSKPAQPLTLCQVYKLAIESGWIVVPCKVSLYSWELRARHQTLCPDCKTHYIKQLLGA